jgi:hypothetical protein
MRSDHIREGIEELRVAKLRDPLLREILEGS